MRFIDTHCHLDFQQFDSDRDGLIQRCGNLGIELFILPAVNQSGWDKLISLGKRYTQVRCALGIHPRYLTGDYEIELSRLETAIQAHRECVIAVGEVGLDFYDQDSDRNTQLLAFQTQVEVAKRLNLPLIIHARKSHDQVLKVVRNLGFTNGGIIHSFSGSYQQAKNYTNAGFKLGVGGVITFNRSSRLQEVVKKGNLSWFVLETDSPDMKVFGFNEEYTSPEAIPLIFEAFSRYRTESADESRRQLFMNSVSLFQGLRGGAGV